MSVTFAVDEVDSLGEKSEESVTVETLHRYAGMRRVRGSALNHPPPYFAGMTHALTETIHHAYARHLPLVLAPDDVWLTLTQGFAHHVRVHSEELRTQLVRHPGKANITVRHDGCAPNAATNPWPEVLAAWREEIHRAAEPAQRLIEVDYSTTGGVERVVQGVVLLGALQDYFNYGLMTACGIPRITLEGTPEDWILLLDKTQALGDYGLEDWVRRVEPVLQQFVLAARGQEDREFWRSIYKVRQESGGPYITGWITTLYPYVSNPKGFREPPIPNPYLDWERPRGKYDALTTTELPRSMLRVLFQWQYGELCYPMAFHGGFLGYRVDPDTRAVRPVQGWAVTQEGDPPVPLGIPLPPTDPLPISISPWTSDSHSPGA